MADASGCKIARAHVHRDATLLSNHHWRRRATALSHLWQTIHPFRSETAGALCKSTMRYRVNYGELDSMYVYSSMPLRFYAQHPSGHVLSLLQCACCTLSDNVNA
jgi:hypothetical protein